MMLLFHEALRGQRQALGMDESRASKLLGLTLPGYCDLEAYEDEWKMVVPLYVTIFACRLFDINLLDFVSEQAGLGIEPKRSAGECIKQRRKVLGLSEEEFADRCGFHPSFATVVETDDGLLLYPFESTRVVCKTLELDLKSFVKNALLRRR